MLRFLIPFFMIAVSGCTLFRKDMDDDDEIVKMGEAVLKSRQGIEIQFKPIEKEKK